MQLPDFSLIIKIDCTPQVFKGVKVRRTESEEESADVLNKFYQDIPGRVLQVASSTRGYATLGE